jgi:hypothetical protein
MLGDPTHCNATTALSAGLWKSLKPDPLPHAPFAEHATVFTQAIRDIGAGFKSTHRVPQLNELDHLHTHRHQLLARFRTREVTIDLNANVVLQGQHGGSQDRDFTPNLVDSVVHDL